MFHDPLPDLKLPPEPPRWTTGERVMAALFVGFVVFLAWLAIGCGTARPGVLRVAGPDAGDPLAPAAKLRNP